MAKRLVTLSNVETLAAWPYNEAPQHIVVLWNERAEKFYCVDNPNRGNRLTQSPFCTANIPKPLQNFSSSARLHRPPVVSALDSVEGLAYKVYPAWEGAC